MAVTLDSLKKAIKKNKGRSQALAWLADMERTSGDYEAALKLADEALAASPSDVPAMLVRAKILVGMQDFAGSITEYKKVLAKDPFCLAAHKRMGESYDKLGKVAERNACFRRVHDMDPLDPFWKDDYDVLTEEEQASLVAPPMDDSSFTMDMSNDSENTESAEDNIFANLAASLPNTDEEDNSAMEDLRSSLDSASDEFSENSEDAENLDFDGHVLNSSEVSSAISGILGGDDDLELNDSSEKEEPATSSLFSHFSDNEEKETLDEQPKSDENEFSLESLDEPQEAEGEETNVDDAFSSLLGDDELPEESAVESAPVEESIEEPVAEEPAADIATPAEEIAEESVFEKSADIEDSAELDAPAETTKTAEESQSEPAEEESLGSLFEKSADADFSLVETPEESSVPTDHMDFSDEESGEADLLDLGEPVAEKAEDEETNVDDAFSSLLGDDELPEESAAESAPVEESIEEPAAEEPAADIATPAEETAEESGFEKSADIEDSAELDVPAETTEAAEESQSEPAEESLDSLFEKSADADFAIDDTADSSLEKAPEFVPDESADVAPVDGLVPTSHMDFTEDEAPSKSDDDFILNLDEETPAEETPAVETPAEELATEASTDAVVEEESVVEEAPKVEEESAAEEVDGAFDALFGDESSEDSSEEISQEKSEENSEETPVAEEQVLEAPVLEEPAEETSVAEAPVVEEPVQEDVAKEMGGAFASMFGDDDDLKLPAEKQEEPVAETLAEEPLSQEATGAEIEESAVKDDVKESVDESFDSIFGKDDDLDLPEEPAAEQVAETSAEEEKPAEPVEEAPSAALDSIDSEVSNAFKGLFDEDDSLNEADEPNNKGVDYLMSGDSDDELSASLVNDADAPLSRGAADLDDSLNTRTLADIYMEQGVYSKALEIYSDLAKKNPDNAEIKSRLEEVQKLCREKFGEN